MNHQGLLDSSKWTTGCKYY